jgi:hypothetical protein
MGPSFPGIAGAGDRGDDAVKYGGERQNPASTPGVDAALVIMTPRTGSDAGKQYQERM